MKEIYRKICLLGDPGVGKTSLVRRYVLDIFDDHYIPSIGMKVTKKNIELEEGSITLTLMIWDILGGKTNRFDSIYYKGVKGTLIVFDVTRMTTMDNLSKWISGLYEITGEVPIIIIGNKIDLKYKNKAVDKKISEFAKKYDAEYLYTSAKTGDEVNKAFLSLARKVV